MEAKKDARKVKAREVYALVAEKEAELLRLTALGDSLARVELEQKEIIARLSNNEYVSL